jgi:hypothetical protein
MSRRSAQLWRDGRGVSTTTPLCALALVSSLKPSAAESSTQLIVSEVLEQLAGHDVSGELVRVVDHDVEPGVEKDLGDGDAWPASLAPDALRAIAAGHARRVEHWQSVGQQVEVPPGGPGWHRTPCGLSRLDTPGVSSTGSPSGSRCRSPG